MLDSTVRECLVDYKKKLEIVELWEQAFLAFESGVCNKAVKHACPELTEKIVENEKLHYRLNVMKRSLFDSEKSSSTSTPIEIMDSNDDTITGKLNCIIAETLKKLYPSIGNNFTWVVHETSQKKFGDYQFNGTTQIVAFLAKANPTAAKLNPAEMARQIAHALPTDSIIGKAEAASVFVNIFLSSEYLSQRIASIFFDGIKIPKLEHRKVVVDFSSPNIAKQMHVGHLRSTIIGESICRLLELVQFDVLRLNHIGDWGTQFGMLIAHLQDRFPNYANEIPPIQDLQAFYKESKKRFDEDAAFKIRAYECVVKLQNDDKNIRQAWRLICDVSRKDFEKLYERLDIRLIERGESFYQSRMVALVEELQKAGRLQEDNGRKIFFPKSCTIPLTMVKSDGGFTYDTSDLATLRQRLDEERADWCLYVVDTGQSEHFETIFAAARELGWYNPRKSRVEHVSFGLVLGEDKKKFKTRSGDTVKLTDLLNEGLVRAEAKLREKGRDKELTAEEFQHAKEAIAYGCVKYVDLSHCRTSDYVFSYDKMLEDRGNTAVYLLYAYARIRAIARTANVTPAQIRAYFNSLGDGTVSLPLTEEREFNLAKQIIKFSDCLLYVIKTLQMNKLCDYVYNLATTFHDFYGECYVVHKVGDGKVEIDFHRLVLCEVTADVMLQCFNLLGLRAVEKM